MSVYFYLQCILVVTTISKFECGVVSTTEHPPETSQSDLLLNITRRMDILEAQNVKMMTVLLNTQTQKIPEFQKSDYPNDCYEVKARGHTDSGGYIIKTKISPQPFAVFCDMHTKGGGWTYFFNRFDGSTEFYLKWSDYKIGFGSLLEEHWLGLEYLHQLTGTVLITKKSNNFVFQSLEITKCWWKWRIGTKWLPMLTTTFSLWVQKVRGTS